VYNINVRKPVTVSNVVNDKLLGNSDAFSQRFIGFCRCAQFIGEPKKDIISLDKCF